MAIDLHAYRIPGQRRSDEPRGHRAEPLRRPRRQTLQDSAARETERVEAVRNRPLETRGARDLRIGVNWHVVPTGLPIEERRLLRRAIVEAGRRRLLRSICRTRGRGDPERAASPLFAQELQRAQAGERLASSLVADFGRKMDQDAAADPFVLDGENPVFRPDRSLQRQGTVQHEALLTVQDATARRSPRPVRRARTAANPA